MTQLGDFDSATAVEPLGDGRFGATVHEGWDVVGNAHGGYLLAIAGRAIGAATGRPDPITITAHYLRAGTPGPVTVNVEVLRSGRRFSSATATVESADGPVIAVLATFGELSPDDEHPTLIDGAPPELPAPEGLRRIQPDTPFPPNFLGHLDLRLHPDDSRFYEGGRSGDARIRGWLRLPDGQPIDTTALLTVVDAFPPTIFNVDLPVGWVPTLELTAHLRARPVPGWLACEVRTRFVSSGFLEVDGEYWDESGVLVAQSRQLALLPRPM